MRILKYFVTGYKNLDSCNLAPDGLHVITGCNGIGKSNLLETFSVLNLILSGSEAERNMILSGHNINSGQWVPMLKKAIQQPVFSLDGEVVVDEKLWLFSYTLMLTKPEMGDTPYKIESELEIFSETLDIKESGTPGKYRRVVSRSLDGDTNVAYDHRKKLSFSVLNNMSALSALKIREANEFNTKFPVISNILNALTTVKILTLNPKAIAISNKNYSARNEFSNTAINRAFITTVNLYENFKALKEDTFCWDQILYWSNKLLRISTIELTELNSEPSLGLETQTTNKYIYFRQDDKLLFAHELSSGSITILAMLSILLSPKLSESVLLIEEPEAYIHPKAIVDLFVLLNELSQESTIIVSTHNPIVLNSLSPKQVTLVSLDDKGMAITKPVSEMKNAMAVLDRGYINFGDLLQNGFDCE